MHEANDDLKKVEELGGDSEMRGTHDFKIF